MFKQKLRGPASRGPFLLSPSQVNVFAASVGANSAKYQDEIASKMIQG